MLLLRLILKWNYTQFMDNYLSLDASRDGLAIKERSSIDLIERIGIDLGFL
jgi:hypothetical protein